MVHNCYDKTFSGANTLGGAIAYALTSLLKIIWVADFVEVQVISKFHKGIHFYYVLLIIKD